MDDVDAIRERYLEADAEASDQYQPHVRKIRRALDDIPALLGLVADARRDLAAAREELRRYLAVETTLTEDGRLRLAEQAGADQERVAAVAWLRGVARNRQDQALADAADALEAGEHAAPTA